MKSYYFKRIYRLVLLLILISIQLASYGQDVTLMTQADVDAFDPTTTQVNGNLRIGGSGWSESELSDITNIDNLSNLQQISGNLDIFYIDSLPQIDGLNALEEVTGSVKLSGIYKLINLDGFNNLLTIGDSLRISGMINMTDIDGFDNLSSIGGELEIRSYNVQHINGFTNLSTVAENIDIWSNSLLVDIYGFSNLIYIGGDLKIRNNLKLEYINGFSSVSTIKGSVNFNNNKKLRNIDGLISITKLDADLSLVFNDALRDIDGLKNIVSIGGNVNISAAFNIKNLIGLSSLTKIAGSLKLHNLNNVVNLDDLYNLSSIGSDLEISSNKRLLNIAGLSNITSVPGNLEVSYNDILSNVDGLTQVINIGENLTLDRNSLLQNVDGLRKITLVGGDVTIKRNVYLTDCCGIHELVEDQASSIGGAVEIFDNPSQCSSIQDVLESQLCRMYLIPSLTPPCIDVENGAIQIFVKNYNEIPFNYNWQRLEDGIIGNGVSELNGWTIDMLGAGTYNITVTNTEPDTATKLNIVLSPSVGEVFEVVKIKTTNSSNGLNNGSIMVTTEGGTGLYNYTWSGEAFGSELGVTNSYFTIPSLNYGEYLITIEDNTGTIKVIEVSLLDETIQVIPCEKPLDIVILNDVSGSVDAIEYKESKQFFVDFLQEVNIGTGAEGSRAAIIEWSSESDQEVLIPITGDITTLQSYVDESRAFSGGTAPHQSMVFGESYLDINARSNAEKVIILSTDGSGGQISNSLGALADELKADGYHIITVAFDKAYSDSNTRDILRRVASVDALAPGASSYSLLDENLARSIVYNYLCPIDPGSSATAYFNRDGEINIIEINPIGNCPYPDFVEVTIDVSAYRELSIPAGTPITFYHNNPNQAGATPIRTWMIPCAILVDSTETYTIILPMDGPSNIYSVLNDDGAQGPPISFPITQTEEIAYSNNIDNERICLDDQATIQALKHSTLPIPACDTLVNYTINVCNISEIDAFGILVSDLYPTGFVLTGSLFNDNGCATNLGDSYNLPANCCFSLYLTYDAGAAAFGYYGDQGVSLGGPVNQTYFGFDGNTTTDEDVILDGTIDCPSTNITFSKAVNVDESCDDGFVEFTFTINNEMNIPLHGLNFSDVLPDPCTWVYQPYGESGLSIANAELIGNESFFIIDEVQANTVAIFHMDARLNSWVDDGTLSNTATLGNVPDVVDGGNITLTSNTTSTYITASPKIILPDTLIVNFANDTVVLEALLTTFADVTWTTEGDGKFTEENEENTLYIVGAQDSVNGEVMLFISAETDCNETGASVLIQFVDCNIEVDIIEIGECNNMGTPLNGSDDTYEITLMVKGVNIGVDSMFVLSLDSGADTSSYLMEYILTLSADGIEDTLSFVDLEFQSCFTEIIVNQEMCLEDCILNFIDESIYDCDDNGTPLDSTDDTYLFEFIAETNTTYNVYQNDNLYGPFESNVKESILLSANGLPDTLFFVTLDNDSCYIEEVVNQNSCAVEIEVVDSLDFIIPNVFTPNGDGNNDVWSITVMGDNTTFLDCIIFDRWGNRVYFSTGIIPVWDGQYNQVFASEGVYIYVITYSNDNLMTQRRIGNVTVIH